ncbi:MAG: azurin [Pseudomonadota bacterium]
MKRLILALICLTSPLAHAACELEIGAADMLQFDKPVLEVERSCGTVKLTLTHTGNLAKNIMGHNWVLSKAEDLNGIAQDGFAAGLDNHYVKPGDSRVLASTEIIGGGEQTSIEFSLESLTDSEYTYFCSFPGHWAIMKGVLKIK